MIWSVIQQVGGQLANFVVFLILAALLEPAEFGLAAMAGVWIAVLGGFAESGFGAALIQRRELRPEHPSTTFAVNLAVGALLAAVGVALSWPAAAFFRTPQLQPVMAVLSSAFLVRAVGVTQTALAQRELRFRSLAVRDIVANLSGGAVGVALALGGAGVWSLVAVTLVTAAVGTLLLWRLSPWRPKRSEMSVAWAAELWPYSSQVLGFNLFKVMAQHADRFVLGYWLGAHAVGLYAFASRLVVFPVMTLAGALGQYLFPRVSQLQDNLPGVRQQYLLVTAVTLTVAFPILVGAAVLAPVAVVPVFGAEWAPAVPVMQLLAVTAAVQALFSPVGQLMKGLDRPAWLLRWSIGVTGLIAVSVWIGSAWGVTGAAWGMALAHLAALPVNLAIAHRLVPVRAADVLRWWVPSALAAALFGAVLWGVLHVGRLPPAAGAFGGIAVGLVVYLLAIPKLSPHLAELALARFRVAPRLVAPPAASAHYNPVASDPNL